MNEKISVIIPIYNVEKYLKQTLDSIRFQTYKNLEILCVLDCPTDNSEKIAEEIVKEDSRVKLVNHSKNMGLPAARNSGVANATGEYIHFCDSDDLLSPDFYEAMINAAVNNDADVATCSVFYEKKPKQSIWFSQDEVVFGESKIEKTKVVWTGWAWRYLIRKSFWLRHNLSFPNLVPLEDSPVMIPMVFYANKVVFCKDAVYYYKNREQSILNVKTKDLTREKRFKENRKTAEKIIFDFMRKYKIKRANKLQRKYVSLRTIKTKLENSSVKYGETNEKISVIIPIYNVEKYLEQTLNSIRFQTYKNLEIVCVLDCPTDNSAKIIEDAAQKDTRIKAIYNAKNMGLPKTRNIGFENATGQYIHFCDADDLLSPDFYDTMVSAAVKNDADVAACSVFYEKKPYRSIWFCRNSVLSSIDEKIEKTEVTLHGWSWRYLIKKSFWEEQKFSFPDLVPMEDMPVMIPMIYYAKKVVLCPSAVYFYKNREGSILNKKYDPERAKKRSENRQKSREIFNGFIRANKIKRSSRLLEEIKKRFM